jgi:hypothetical protein
MWADSPFLLKYILALYVHSLKAKGNLFYLKVQFAPCSKQCPWL